MIERFIEHTLLKPEATAADIMKLCREARDNHFLGVCVNPCFVRTAKQQLAGTDIKVVSVVGFPLGCDAPEVKAAATRRAVQDGADEIDMVINVGALKEHDDEPVMDDIRQVVVAAGTAPVKVIIETCLLNEEEKIRACGLIAQAGAAFVKTSTGFNKAGATVEDVTLLSVQAKKL
ncbi:MAG: deoxyribose-phosphate aldolase, partial [Acidaminococcaceae bacterium]|nr:deoxyribose-phosphate aldolase [Acidaminococcaceae bacterium]